MIVKSEVFFNLFVGVKRGLIALNIHLFLLERTPEPFSGTAPRRLLKAIFTAVWYNIYVVVNLKNTRRNLAVFCARDEKEMYEKSPCPL